MVEGASRGAADKLESVLECAFRPEEHEGESDDAAWD